MKKHSRTAILLFVAAILPIYSQDFYLKKEFPNITMNDNQTKLVFLDDYFVGNSLNFTIPDDSPFKLVPNMTVLNQYGFSRELSEKHQFIITSANKTAPKWMPGSTIAVLEPSNLFFSTATIPPAGSVINWTTIILNTTNDTKFNCYTMLKLNDDSYLIDCLQYPNNTNKTNTTNTTYTASMTNDNNCSNFAIIIKNLNIDSKIYIDQTVCPPENYRREMIYWPFNDTSSQIIRYSTTSFNIDVLRISQENLVELFMSLNLTQYKSDNLNAVWVMNSMLYFAIYNYRYTQILRALRQTNGSLSIDLSSNVTFGDEQILSAQTTWNSSSEDVLLVGQKRIYKCVGNKLEESFVIDLTIGLSPKASSFNKEFAAISVSNNEIPYLYFYSLKEDFSLNIFSRLKQIYSTSYLYMDSQSNILMTASNNSLSIYCLQRPALNLTNFTGKYKFNLTIKSFDGQPFNLTLNILSLPSNTSEVIPLRSSMDVLPSYFSLISLADAFEGAFLSYNIRILSKYTFAIRKKETSCRETQLPVNGNPILIRMDRSLQAEKFRLTYIDEGLNLIVYSCSLKFVGLESLLTSIYCSETKTLAGQIIQDIIVESFLFDVLLMNINDYSQALRFYSVAEDPFTYGLATVILPFGYFCSKLLLMDPKTFNYPFLFCVGDTFIRIFDPFEVLASASSIKNIVIDAALLNLGMQFDPKDVQFSEWSQDVLFVQCSQSIVVIQISFDLSLPVQVLNVMNLPGSFVSAVCLNKLVVLYTSSDLLEIYDITDFKQIYKQQTSSIRIDNRASAQLSLSSQCFVYISTLDNQNNSTTTVLNLMMDRNSIFYDTIPAKNISLLATVRIGDSSFYSSELCIWYDSKWNVNQIFRSPFISITNTTTELDKPYPSVNLIITAKNTASGAEVSTNLTIRSFNTQLKVSPKKTEYDLARVGSPFTFSIGELFEGTVFDLMLDNITNLSLSPQIKVSNDLTLNTTDIQSFARANNSYFILHKKSAEVSFNSMTSWIEKTFTIEASTICKNLFMGNIEFFGIFLCERTGLDSQELSAYCFDTGIINPFIDLPSITKVVVKGQYVFVMTQPDGFGVFFRVFMINSPNCNAELKAEVSQYALGINHFLPTDFAVFSHTCPAPSLTDVCWMLFFTGPTIGIIEIQYDAKIMSGVAQVKQIDFVDAFTTFPNITSSWFNSLQVLSGNWNAIDTTLSVKLLLRSDEWNSYILNLTIQVRSCNVRSSFVLELLTLQGYEFLPLYGANQDFFTALAYNQRDNQLYLFFYNISDQQLNGTNSLHATPQARIQVFKNFNMSSVDSLIFQFFDDPTDPLIYLLDKTSRYLTVYSLKRNLALTWPAANDDVEFNISVSNDQWNATMRFKLENKKISKLALYLIIFGSTILLVAIVVGAIKLRRHLKQKKIKIRGRNEDPLYKILYES